MKNYLSILIACLSLLSLVSGCNQDSQNPKPDGPAPQSLPTTRMTIGRGTIITEIADNEGTREIGLMYRKSMPKDHGMIFVFPEATPQGFWMKNCYIPLDIVYLDSDRRIVNISRMLPQDISIVHSAAPSQYAIELNAGVADDLGLSVGQVIDLPTDIKPAVR